MPVVTTHVKSGCFLGIVPGKLRDGGVMAKGAVRGRSPAFENKANPPPIGIRNIDFLVRKQEKF